MDAEEMKTYIIQWLFEGGIGFDKKQDAIGLEVRFSQNRRLADMLIISEKFHSLEIKGERDNLTKLSAQIDDYQKTFEMVSVVIAPKHLREIRNLLPTRIGIILFNNGILTLLRKAKTKKRLDRNSLLMFFNKYELSKMLQVKKLRNYSTDELRFIAKANLSLNQIHQAVFNKLYMKYKRLTTLLQQDIGSNILKDDLQTLYGQIEEIK
ncbi:MAG: sce7726 family protein [Planctomycetes bacterium]|nr:sce7726 family protein [Planctomycetota bacterium]